MSSPTFAPDGLVSGHGSIAASHSAYQDHTTRIASLVESKKGTWDAINPENVARMRMQNRFQTGLDIARYTAGVMRADMAAYDA